MTGWKLTVLLLVCQCVGQGYSLQCLRCDAITHPRNCQVVTTCSSNEVCYARSVEALDGVKTYDLGCTDRSASHVCSAEPGASFQCSECCEDHDLCNAETCGENGYPLQRGPICFNCDSRVVGEPCHIVDFCGEDQVCSYVQQRRFSDLIYTSKCSQKHACETHYHGGVIVGKRSVDYDADDDLTPGNCQVCCFDDLCNTQCRSTSAQPSPTQTIAIQPSSTKTTPTQPSSTQQSSTKTTPTKISSTQTSPAASVAHDCLDILRLGLGSTSGVYTVTLPRSHVSLQVYCDMDTNGGGWTVFQNRFDGQVDFYRNMSEYVHGFGSIQGEFWLGLAYIEELTKYCNTTSDLRLDLVKADGTAGYEVFRNFSLSPGPSYTLHLEPGNGTVGDSDGMSYNNGHDFYTYDHDTAIDVLRNCADLFHGGWWYTNCGAANLNGEYVHPPGSESSYGYGWGGMVYYDFDGFKSLKSSKMMFRRHTPGQC